MPELAPVIATDEDADWPCDRIVFDIPTQRFVIDADRALLTAPYLAAIRAHFQIPPPVDAYPDPHYRSTRCLITRTRARRGRHRWSEPRPLYSLGLAAIDVQVWGLLETFRIFIFLVFHKSAHGSFIRAALSAQRINDRLWACREGYKNDCSNPLRMDKGPETSVASNSATMRKGTARTYSPSIFLQQEVKVCVNLADHLRCLTTSGLGVSGERRKVCQCDHRHPQHTIHKSRCQFRWEDDWTILRFC